MRSLKLRLFGLWALSLVASVAVGMLLVQISRQSTEAQVERAEAVIARACDLVRDHYGFYVSGWSGPVPAMSDASLRADLAAVVRLALAHEDGVEGGIWQADAGAVADADPTHAGGGARTDLTMAERELVRTVNQQAARDEQPAERQVTVGVQTLLLHACVLPGPIAGLTGWTMTRVIASQGYRPLRLGLGILLGLMLLMSALLARTLLVWGRHVRGIEAALAVAGPGEMPAMPRTGEVEFDRIVDALNEARLRLAEARQGSEVMALRVARAERLAGLGRVAAGVAHEIRNPIAAARLQGENALAGDDARRRVAIADMLGQIDRLDTLVGELLAMTQRVEPRPVWLELPSFLESTVSRHREIASARRITIVVQGAAGTAWLDPVVIGRVLDNLLVNAIRHGPEGGTVLLSVERDEREAAGLVLVVEDAGAGVPAGMAARLFEPFVTSRADGTGLGLAIARELADAHGGRLTLRGDGGGEGGAVFALELPQGQALPQDGALPQDRALSQGDAWPPS